MKIRNADLSDLPGILAILNEAILNSTAVYEYDERSLEEQKLWFQQKKTKKMPVIVAVKANEIIGFGTFDYFRPRIGYKNTVEHSVYVANEFQGKGVGKLLLMDLIEKATELGYHTMIAGIDAGNESSIDFHKKFGFREVGRLNEVGFKFNTWLDVVFMQRMLIKK